MATRLLLPVTLLTVLSFVASTSAQVPTPSPDDRPIVVRTVLVNVPVIVSDAGGRNVAGLAKENFSVTQRGFIKPIEFFASQDGPVTFAIVVDSSGSTSGVLSSLASDARAFLKMVGPEDRGIVVSFDSGVNMLLKEFTSDIGRLKGAINNLGRVGGPGSVMNDAIYRLVTREFSSVTGKKAVIVLTDGDVEGKISHEKLLRTLVESDVVVYPIFYQTRRLFPSNVKTISYNELITTPPVNGLHSIAVATGGRLYAADGTDFSIAFQNIAAELKKQYVIGFYPANTENGDINDIKIEVNRPDAIVRTKPTIRVKLPEPPSSKIP